jgi:hypothetical protein
VRGIKYFVGIAAFAALLAGCAFTSPNGTHVIFNPKNAATVPCITPAGCIGPDGVSYPYQAQVPTSATPKFTLAPGLYRTDGTADGAAACTWQRYDHSGFLAADQSSDHGARYVQIPAGDTEFRTSGCKPWHRYDGTEQVGGSVPIPDTHYTPPDCCQIFHPRQSFADGDYISGHETFAPPPTGGYTGDINGPQIGVLNVYVPNSNPPVVDRDKALACHWYKLSNWSGEPYAIIASGNGYGENLPQGQGWISIPQEGVGLRLVDCGGLWTPG